MFGLPPILFWLIVALLAWLGLRKFGVVGR